MRLLEIWRYPVKSMLGESVSDVSVTPEGLTGDRSWAVVDASTGVSLSAKRYGELLRCRAWMDGGQVMVALPEGGTYEAESPQLAIDLSSLLDRTVRLQQAGESAVRHEFPSDLAGGGDEVFIHEPGLSAFVDRAPIHLLTTSSLQELGRLRPESVFDVVRFRPNFLAETPRDGFLEDTWVGGSVAIGEVPFAVLDTKPRCVMTTRAQGDLDKDSQVLRTVAQHNGGNAGVELRASESGTVRLGESIVRPT